MSNVVNILRSQLEPLLERHAALIREASKLYDEIKAINVALRALDPVKRTENSDRRNAAGFSGTSQAGRLLAAFTNEPQRASSVSRRIGIPDASAACAVKCLKDQGYLERTGVGLYRRTGKRADWERTEPRNLPVAHVK